MGLFSDTMRGARGFAAKQFARQYLARYGEVLDLEIDSGKRTLMFHFLPKGERDNVLVRILGYNIVDEGAKTFITIEKLEASREWIGLLAQDFVVGRKIEIPAKYASAVKMAL